MQEDTSNWGGGGGSLCDVEMTKYLLVITGNVNNDMGNKKNRSV